MHKNIYFQFVFFPYFLTYFLLRINLNSKIYKVINAFKMLLSYYILLIYFSFSVAVLKYLFFDWFIISPESLVSFSNVRKLSTRVFGFLLQLPNHPHMHTVELILYLCYLWCLIFLLNFLRSN